jgi:ribosome biogenesis protein BMS1
LQDDDGEDMDEEDADLEDEDASRKDLSDAKDEETHLMAKKRKLKEAFDAEFDDEKTIGKKTYYDSLKDEVDQQAQLNRSEFASLDDDQRIKYEGFRPGLYVRIKINKVSPLLVSF